MHSLRGTRCGCANTVRSGRHPVDGLFPGQACAVELSQRCTTSLSWRSIAQGALLLKNGAFHNSFPPAKEAASPVWSSAGGDGTGGTRSRPDACKWPAGRLLASRRRRRQQHESRASSSRRRQHRGCRASRWQQQHRRHSGSTSSSTISSTDGGNGGGSRGRRPSATSRRGDGDARACSSVLRGAAQRQAAAARHAPVARHRCADPGFLALDRHHLRPAAAALPPLLRAGCGAAHLAGARRRRAVCVWRAGGVERAALCHRHERRAAQGAWRRLLGGHAG